MRIKVFLINIASSYAHIILSVIINIIYIPIALHYLGVERYGVWVVLLTLTNYLTIANFGIPTVVTNLMSQSENKLEKADILLKGFKILSLICLSLLTFSIISYFTIFYFTSWFGTLSNEIIVSSIILIILFILRMPFQISSSVFIANKKIYISKIYELTTIIITFLSLLILIYFKQDLIFLAILSGILLLLLNIGSFFNALKILETTKHKIKNITIVKNKEIYKPGLVFFIISMGSVLIWNTDNIVISKFLGFEEVAIYSTTFRLFSFGFMTFGLINGLLIPYYGQFYKRKEWDKFENLFKAILSILPFMAICVWLILWLFAKDIIHLWIGDYKLYGGSNLYFILGAYGLVLAYVGVMYNLLSSLNILKGLIFLTISEAIINLGASIFFVRFLGIEGVALGTLIGSTVASLIILPFLIDKNDTLGFPFPFKIFLFNLIFYVFILFSLFLIKANEYSFYSKILISIVSISIFFSFQYFTNKDLIIKVYKIIRTRENRIV